MSSEMIRWQNKMKDKREASAMTYNSYVMMGPHRKHNNVHQKHHYLVSVYGPKARQSSRLIISIPKRTHGDVAIHEAAVELKRTLTLLSPSG